jgi:Tfp pilus assembly major pilin PilA
MMMKGPRKRVMVVAAVAVSLVAIAGTAVAAYGAGGTVNGVARDATAVPASNARCVIADDSGNPVKSVNIDVRSGSDTVYWVDFNAASAATSATVSIKQNPTGFWSMTQKATDLVGGGFYIVPFGVPQWGGNATAGKYKVKVTFNNDGGSSTCSFTATTPS